DTISSARMFDLFDQRQGLKRERASMNEFTLNNQRIRDMLIKLLRKSGRHVIVVAHEKEEREVDSAGNVTRTLIRPDMPNELLQSTKRLFSAVYYYHIIGESQGSDVRKLVLSSNTTTLTKSRIQLRKEYVNPKWTDVEADMN